MRLPPGAKRVLGTLAAASIVLIGAHLGILALTRMVPPRVDAPQGSASDAPTARRAGLREVFLSGTPENIGLEHARALADRMSIDEGALWGEYERRVPWWLARVGLLDWGRLRFRALDMAIPDARRRELAGEAIGFAHDPFADRMATYQRLLFLHSLYDLSVPLEQSPLIGCTTFGLSSDRTSDGHTLVGRTFDFEAGDWFDRDKTVFLVRERGSIPFASVGWPGFVGVVTGMNAEGVLVVVHGGRASGAISDGLPVAFSLRQVLASAHDINDAVALLCTQQVLVSHIVFVADAQGHFAIVERAPGSPAFVRWPSGSTALTNHFEGPLAADPANLRVERTTSTLARRARADALLAQQPPGSVTPATVVALLRDRRCSADPDCPFGDRRAIDSGIATHGIVADTTARVLWVSAGPHLQGHFVRLDLTVLLADGYDPSRDVEPQTLP